jgi:transcriptional regulator with XRE-family HTH domain
MFVKTDMPVVDATTLKTAREARGLTSSDIARDTRLSPRTITAIEEGRFNDLPAGLYARTFVRAYAGAIGLDPAGVLAELQPQLPSARLDLLALADARKLHRSNGTRRYVLAGAIDVAVLLAINAAIVLVCAAACGTPPFHLLGAAPGSMSLLCGTAAGLYFWLLGATDVRTAGPWMVGVEILPRARGPMALNLFLRRGVAYVAREIELMFVSTSQPDQA